MKKQFNIPHVFLVTPLEVSPDPSGGPGSNFGGMSVKPIPMSFSEWSQSRFVSDYDANPGVDFDDYAKWFSDSGFGADTWSVLNPGAEMTDETK